MLEVCVDSIESVIGAVEGGAKRIELCSGLSEGGLTPSPGTLKTIKTHYPNLTIFAMIRPRSGDFVYTDIEMESILADVDTLKECGADGFVFGALTVNLEINFEQCNTVRKHCQPLPVTFHRAFDITDVEKMIENARQIEAMGYDRLLTSGFEETVEVGLSRIAKLVKSMKTLIIIPGSGISLDNAEKILCQSGCKEFHATAKVTKNKNAFLQVVPRIDFGGGLYKTDAGIVRKLVEIGKNYL